MPPDPPTGRRAAFSVLAGLLLVGGLLVLPRLRQAEPRLVTLRLSGETMGTHYQVQVVVTEASQHVQQALATAVNEQLDGVDARMSTYQPGSEISRFGGWPAGEPMPISADTLELLLLSRQLSERSGGAFDVTVSPLVQLWGFHEKRDLETEPDPEVLQAARQRVGFGMLEIHDGSDSLSKQHPGLAVDLSAIAKGHGVDRVAQALDALGHEHYLVEIGGELRLRGRSVDGDPWRVGIERPLDDARQVHTALALESGAMATSGDYRQFYRLDGERFSHTIDPRTGRPVEHDLASVSVVHPSCALADGWATALMVLGPDEGSAVAEREGLAAFFIRRKDDGSFVAWSSPAFATIMAESTP